MLTRKGFLRAFKGLKPFSTQAIIVTQFHHKELQLFDDVITRDEEADIAKFLKPILSRKRYEGNHWDDVIQQYKELELGNNYKIPDNIKAIMKKVESKIIDSIGYSADFLSPHVIDLSAEGYIGPHVDSVKFSGGFVCGLSLQSTRIMALTYSTEDADQASGMYTTTDTTTSTKSSSATRIPSQTKETSSKNLYLKSYSVGSDGLTMECGAAVDSNNDEGTSSSARNLIVHKGSDGVELLLPSLVELVLPPRSLYILRGPWRYNYNHAVLGMDQVPKLIPSLPDPATQRCSIIFRDVKT